MKRIIFVLFVAFAMSSCSDDSPAAPDVDKPGNNDPDVETEKIEQYEETFHHAVDYLNSLDSFSDTTAIVAELGKLAGVRNIAREGEMLVVTLSNGLDFDVDLRQGSRSEWECENPYTDERITEMADSIGEALGWTDSEEDGFVPTDDVLDSSTEASRAATSSAGRVRILKKKNVLVWNPYPDLAKEDKRTVNKIVKYKRGEDGKKTGNEVRYTINFSPESFSRFSNYDLVWVGSHGNQRGDVLLPCCWLNQDEFNEYKALIGKGVRYSYRTVWEDGKKYMEYISFSLGKAFFDKYMPDLSNTIIWTCFCYSGLPKGSFYQACKAKNAASYFGSPHVCTATDIYTIFGWFYPALDKGRSANYAFAANNAWCYKCHTKPGGDTFDYNRCINNYVSYVAPRTRPVRSVKRRAIARSSEDNYEYAACVQVHYDLDEGSTPPSDGAEIGAVLRNTATGSTRYINNIVNDESRTVAGNHVVRDFEILLDNLEHDAEYSVTGYVQTSQGIIYADQSYVFTAKDSTPTYIISNAKELRDFLNSTGVDINEPAVNAEIVADIDLGEYTASKECEGRFSGTINGNGHTVKMRYTRNSTPWYYDMDGGIKNLNVDCTIESMKSKREDNYLIGFHNNGVVSGCNFKFNFMFGGDGLEYPGTSVESPGPAGFGGGFSSNNGTIEDCSVSVSGKVSIFSAYCSSNDGKIVNCDTYADNLEVFAYMGFAEGNWGDITDCTSKGSVKLQYGGYGADNNGSWIHYPTSSGICNTNYDTISGCTNEMKSQVELEKADVDILSLGLGISGICADNEYIIEKCTNKARLEINNIRYGENIYDRAIYKCYNSCHLIAVGDVAGICLSNGYFGIIKSCVNEGDIVSNGQSTAGICICNYGDGNCINNCINKGSVICTIPIDKLLIVDAFGKHNCSGVSHGSARCVCVGQIMASYGDKSDKGSRQGSLSYPKSDGLFCLYDADIAYDYGSRIFN